MYIKRNRKLEYIERMNKLHPTIILLGEYEKASIKVDLKCSTCGHEWSARPNDSFKGYGCPNCNGSKTKTTDEFILEMSDINPNIKVLGEYYNRVTKIECQCLICNNIWNPTPKNLLDKRGCPHCKKSYGEILTEKWLFDNGIEFETQKSFDDLKCKMLLKFDIYIPKDNILIEIDGVHHRKPIKRFGGEKKYEGYIKRDELKNQYCKDNGIKLIRLKYNGHDKMSSFNKELEKIKFLSSTP